MPSPITVRIANAYARQIVLLNVDQNCFYFLPDKDEAGWRIAQELHLSVQTFHATRSALLLEGLKNRPIKLGRIGPFLPSQRPFGKCLKTFVFFFAKIFLPVELSRYKTHTLSVRKVSCALSESAPRQNFQLFSSKESPSQDFSFYPIILEAGRVDPRTKIMSAPCAALKWTLALPVWHPRTSPRSLVDEKPFGKSNGVITPLLTGGITLSAEEGRRGTCRDLLWLAITYF